MKNINKWLTLIFLSVCLCSAASAQIEVAHLITKTAVPTGFGALTNQNVSITGFGSFLNFGIVVNETSAIIIEGGIYVFSQDDNHFYMGPCLVGFRQLLTQNEDYGWYLEPVLGYTFGDTDIQKSNNNGNPLYQTDGNPLNQKVAGPTTGLGFGYLFQPSGRIRFNIGLRFEHSFVNGDPATNIVALRISHAFSFGRRED
jgi:opacity protein-like surface antigen